MVVKAYPDELRYVPKHRMIDIFNSINVRCGPGGIRVRAVDYDVGVLALKRGVVSMDKVQIETLRAATEGDERPAVDVDILEHVVVAAAHAENVVSSSPRPLAHAHDFKIVHNPIGSSKVNHAAASRIIAACNCRRAQRIVAIDNRSRPRATRVPCLIHAIVDRVGGCTTGTH